MSNITIEKRAGYLILTAHGLTFEDVIEVLKDSRDAGMGIDDVIDEMEKLVQKRNKKELKQHDNAKR
jgi:uncharacterized protein (DUF302 family)